MVGKKARLGTRRPLELLAREVQQPEMTAIDLYPLLGTCKLVIGLACYGRQGTGHLVLRRHHKKGWARDMPCAQPRVPRHRRPRLGSRQVVDPPGAEAPTVFDEPPICRKRLE